MADETPEVQPATIVQSPVKQQRPNRWIFLSIGIFIAVVLLVAILFISYRLLTTEMPVSSPSPINTVLGSPIPIIASPSLEPSPLPPLESVIPVGSDTSDNDQDGLTSAEERYYGTDPINADTDADTFKDGDEVRNGYNPLGEGKLDSDNDGFPDPDERKFGTDPFNPDTDGDGYLEGAEISNGYNPLIASPNDKL